MYYTVIKHDGHLRTRGKCRKHAAQASVFYISRVFSNARRVLSQCNIVLTCVTVLTSKIPHKVENKLPPNSKIQETDPLISLRFGTTFYIYVPIVETFMLHSAAEFLCERPSSIFYRIRTAGSFELLFEDLKPTKFVTVAIKTLRNPSFPIFLPPRFWVVP